MCRLMSWCGWGGVRERSARTTQVRGVLLFAFGAALAGCSRDQDAPPTPTPSNRAVPSAPPTSRVPLDAAALRKWGRSPLLFRGRVTEVVEVTDDLMPETTYRATFVLRIEQVFRGPVTVGQSMRLGYKSAQMPELNGRCLHVAATPFTLPGHAGERDMLTDATSDCSDPGRQELLAVARLPLGWTAENGGLVSPWGEASDAAASAPLTTTPLAPFFCARSGRPAWLTAPGIELRLTPITPQAADAFVNPAGNGTFQVEVTNRGSAPAIVPALVGRDGTTLWKESLLVEINGQVHTLTSGKGLDQGRLTGARLEPGARHTTTLELLPLLGKATGPSFGAGNLFIRVYLGDLADVVTFYFRGDHHRRLLQEQTLERPQGKPSAAELN
jgi:hypothetical protein